MWRNDARLQATIVLAVVILGYRPLLAQPATTPSGEAVYQRRCAACHDQISDRTPPKAALNQMPATRILRALDFGAMMTVAYPMSRGQRQAVASYLGTDQPAISFPASAYCSSRRAVVSATPTSFWNGWSPTASNTRFQGAAAAGLSADAARRLKLKWAFGFEGDVTACAQPTVIDGQIFVGSAGGVIHALRADTGCLQWTYQADGPVRMSIVTVPMARTHVLLFGDQTGKFYALDAETGTEIWKKQIEPHDAARLTGSPVVHPAAPSGAASWLCGSATGSGCGKPTWWMSQSPPAGPSAAPSSADLRGWPCGRRRRSTPSAGSSILPLATTTRRRRRS